MHNKTNETKKMKKKDTKEKKTLGFKSHKLKSSNSVGHSGDRTMQSFVSYFISDRSSCASLNTATYSYLYAPSSLPLL